MLNLFIWNWSWKKDKIYFILLFILFYFVISFHLFLFLFYYVKVWFEPCIFVKQSVTQQMYIFQLRGMRKKYLQTK